MHGINKELGPPPPLSGSLSTLYSGMDIKARKLFNKVFIHLWGVLVPRSRRYGVLHAYWLVERVRNDNKLTVSDLSVLTYLYQVTESGKLVVDSRHLHKSTSLPYCYQVLTLVLIKLRKAGYLVRTSRDPTLPYLQRSVCQQKVFIQLTIQGVALIHKLETDLYKLSYNTTLDDITTNNRKG